jgi:hypothetical protein
VLPLRKRRSSCAITAARAGAPPLEKPKSAKGPAAPAPLWSNISLSGSPLNAEPDRPALRQKGEEYVTTVC